MYYALKVKLENTNDYLAVILAPSLREFGTKIQGRFDLDTDEFDIVYIDSKGDSMVLATETEYRCIPLPHLSSYPKEQHIAMMPGSCLVRLKNKKSTGPEEPHHQEKVLTSTYVTSASKLGSADANSSSRCSCGTYLQDTVNQIEMEDTVPPQQQQQQPQQAETASSSTQLELTAQLLDFYRRMENLVRETTENTTKITQLISQQQEQQKKQTKQKKQKRKKKKQHQQQHQHKSVGTSSHPIDATNLSGNNPFISKSSLSCGGCMTLIVGHHWVCDECPDYHACDLCENQKLIPHNRMHSCQYVDLVTAAAPCQNNSSNVADSKKQHGVNHNNVVCDHCDSSIVGVRYKCGHCLNFDLCESCESSLVHNEDHVFLKIRCPLLPLTTMTTILLPDLNFASKPFDCTTRENPQANPEYEASDTTANDGDKERDDVAPGSNTAPFSTFVDHINVPDGHPVEPSQSFLKIWRLKNTGSVPWSPGSILKYICGNVHPTKLRYQDDVKLPAVMPGEEISVSMYLNSPNTYGQHFGLFCMVTPQGTQFGEPIWCDIMVNAPQTLEVMTPLDTGLDTKGASGETSFTTVNLPLPSSSATCTSGSTFPDGSSAPVNTTTTHQNNNNDGNRDHSGKQHQAPHGPYSSGPATRSAQSLDSQVRGINTTPTQAAIQHHQQASSASSCSADYVVIRKDSMNQLTSSPPSLSSSVHLEPPNEKSPTNHAQTDITYCFKVQKTTDEFAYSQQLTQLHEMNIMHSDEEAKKLLFAHDGDLDLVLAALLETHSLASL